MNRFARFITTPWFRIYTRFESTNVSQTQEQAVNKLLGFHLSSVALSLLVAALAAWLIPAIPKTQEGIIVILELF